MSFPVERLATALLVQHPGSPVLARNEAVSFGGNVIVPATPIQDGAQDFNVFRCR